MIRLICVVLWCIVGACYHLPMVRGSPNPLHFGLPARLRKVRKQAGLTRTAVAQRAGCDPKAAVKIEAGERLPTVGTIARLASGLGLSPGWLAFGLGEQHSEGPAVTTESMGARLQAVRIEQARTKADLARLVGVTPAVIANIEKGSQTGVEVLEAVAKVLDVSPAWLAYNEGPRELPKRRRGEQLRQSV